MLHQNKSTSFLALGAKWELVSFGEISDQIFVRMIQPGGRVTAYDGKIHPVRFKIYRGKPYPCFYAKIDETRKTATVCIPMEEWRSHNNGCSGS